MGAGVVVGRAVWVGLGAVAVGKKVAVGISVFVGVDCFTRDGVTTGFRVGIVAVFVQLANNRTTFNSKIKREIECFFMAAFIFGSGYSPQN